MAGQKNKMCIAMTEIDSISNFRKRNFRQGKKDKGGKLSEGQCTKIVVAASLKIIEIDYRGQETALTSGGTWIVTDVKKLSETISKSSSRAYILML